MLLTRADLEACMMIAAKDLKHTITEEKQNGAKTNVRYLCSLSHPRLTFSTGSSSVSRPIT